MATTRTLRGYLDRAFDASQSAGITLREQLRVQEDYALAVIEKGQVLASASGNGFSTSYSSPGLSSNAELTANDWRHLIDMHDQVASDLGASHTDFTVKAEMMLRLRTAPRSHTTDFSSLRFTSQSLPR